MSFPTEIASSYMVQFKHAVITFQSRKYLSEHSLPEVFIGISHRTSTNGTLQCAGIPLGCHCDISV